MPKTESADLECGVKPDGYGCMNDVVACAVEIIMLVLVILIILGAYFAYRYSIEGCG